MGLDRQQCYDALQAKPGTSIEEVKKNYKQLIKVWHPDRFPNDTSVQRMCVEKMKLLNEAFKTLESLIKLEAAVAEGRYQPHYEEPQEQLAVFLEPVEHMGKWGYADSQGHLRISAIYDTAAEFSEGLAAVSRSDSYGYVDLTGREVIELRFSRADAFSEGRALVEFVRCGYVNRVGDWVVRPRFQAGTVFQDGVAAVKMDGKWGYIQSNGDWFILPRFEEAYPFKHGRAFAKAGGRQMMVMRNGEVRPA